VNSFTERCVGGITANEAVCLANAEKSSAVATALNPHIGYYEAARLAKEALKQNKSIRELAKQEGIMDSDKLDQVLDIRRMTENPDKKGASDKK
jgi:aspartate ammonia-lyase